MILGDVVIFVIVINHTGGRGERGMLPNLELAVLHIISTHKDEPLYI